MLWLTQILSEADHRLDHVESWAEKRLHTLRGCTGRQVHPLDVSDDRSPAVLEALSADERWHASESPPSQHLLCVYALQPECVSLESTAKYIPDPSQHHGDDVEIV
jgi:hypothetical protein